MGIFQKGSRSPPSAFRLDLEANLPSISNPGSSPSPQLHPLVSPGFEDVPIWNILPSYQLYGSTFSKDIDPSSEDFHDDPPTYEVSTPGSSDSGEDYFSASHTGSAQNQAARWEKTILANTHRLKRLAAFNKPLADKLKIDITFTKSPGVRGRNPDIYDPSAVEFSQGDSIHGFVKVVNTHSKPLLFDMFSVVFEGRVSVNSEDESASSKPIVFYKFLNMFDYNASWTPAYFEESDDGVSNKSPSVIDPVDGSNLHLPVEQKIEPGMVYKKFFNFTIPDKLLECACETHQIGNHCYLLPTLGLDKSTFLQRLRKIRETPAKPEPAKFSVGGASAPSRPKSPMPKRPSTPSNILVRDFSFPDTSISYNVEARVVSKLSHYSTTDDSSKDEFIIVKEAGAPIRVTPRDIPSMDAEEEDIIVKKQFDSFVKDVKNYIERGRSLDEGPSAVVSRRESIRKHVYSNGERSEGASSTSDAYEVFLPYKRKTLASPPKVVGMLKAVLPKSERIVRYVEPYTLRPSVDFDTNKSSKVSVPIVLEFLNSEPKNKPPEVRSASVKVVVCTVRSKKYPIPLEFSRDMKFGNTLASNDGIERVVIAPFNTFLSQLTPLIERHGMSALGLNSQTIMDIKCLANLEVKTNSLKLDNVSIKSSGGMAQWEEKPNKPGSYEKAFDITADFQSLFVKNTKSSSEDILRGALSLVPSFQSCIVCRYYYLLVEFKMGNGDTLPVKVPIRVSK